MELQKLTICLAVVLLGILTCKTGKQKKKLFISDLHDAEKKKRLREEIPDATSSDMDVDKNASSSETNLIQLQNVEPIPQIQAGTLEAQPNVPLLSVEDPQNVSETMIITTQSDFRSSNIEQMKADQNIVVAHTQAKNRLAYDLDEELSFTSELFRNHFMEKEQAKVEPAPKKAKTVSSADAHSMQSKGADSQYEDIFLNDAEADSDDGAQNDADGGNEFDEDDDESAVFANITTLPSNYTAIRGSKLRLECNTNPTDNIVIQWKKDGEVYFLGKTRIRNLDRVTLERNTSNLVISDLENTDSGKYECEIMQKKSVSIQHTVHVQEPARVIRFMASNHGRLMEGSDLLLTCDVTGYPKPEILWSRESNGGNVKLTEKDGQFSANTFYATNVKRGMSGMYYCYAVNTAGSQAANLSVTVLGKPRVHVHKTIVNTAVGINAELQCSAHEVPEPHIRWYKDGKLIEDSATQFNINTNGARSVLSVTPWSDSDFGTFTCEAENQHGKHNRSIDLVQSPVVEGLDVDGSKLSWTVHSHQPLEEIEIQLRNLAGDGEWTAMKVPLPEAKANKHEYEVIYVLEEKDLAAGQYEALVKVKNNKSWSRHSEPAVIRIDSEAQPIQTASVFRDNNPNDAKSLRPAAVLATIFTCLLVRML